MGTEGKFDDPIWVTFAVISFDCSDYDLKSSFGGEGAGGPSSELVRILYIFTFAGLLQKRFVLRSILYLTSFES